MVNPASTDAPRAPRLVLKPNPIDVGAAVAGFGLVVYGVGRLSLEAGLILAGVILLASAVLQWEHRE